MEAHPEPLSPLEAIVRPRLPVDLRASLFPLRRGYGDPSVREDRDGSWWRAFRTPLGPVTVRYVPRPADGEVRVQAWGPGAGWALEAAPEAVGARDSLEGFDPPPGPVRQAHRRLPGLRIVRTGTVFAALVPTVLEQKVTGVEAREAWRRLVRAWGEPAPGPGGLLAPPGPEAIARRPGWAFHTLGVEARRAGVLRAAAARAPRLEEAAGMPLAEARLRLAAFPGIGPWTAARVAEVALGDPDAAPVGDFHVPHTVAWALAGEPRGSDERMLELLEPYAGHRGRAVRLLKASGLHAPRFGPRMAPRRIRDI